MQSVPRYAVGVLYKNGMVLMGKRVKNRSSYPNAWSFFGGHCEEHETYYDCLVRELNEELGITVTTATFLAYYDQQPNLQFELYAVTSWVGEVQNCAPNEHDAIQWFSLEKARQLPVAADTYAAVFDRLEREFHS